MSSTEPASPSFSEAVHVRGRGAILIAVGLLIAGVAAVMPWFLNANGTVVPTQNTLRIWAVVACVSAALILGGLCISARRLTLRDGTLRFSSLFRERSCPVETLAHVTHETDQDLHSYIEFWNGERIFLRTALEFWNRRELCSLVQALTRENPSIALDPRIKRIVDAAE